MELFVGHLFIPTAAYRETGRPQFMWGLELHVRNHLCWRGTQTETAYGV